MLKIDIQKFLKEGQLFPMNEIRTEDMVLNKLGKPDDVEDYGNTGRYLHYNNLRFLFSGNELSSIAIFFLNYETSFEINIDDQVFVVQKNIPLTSLLRMLNEMGLKWSVPYEQSKLDYLMVEIESGVKIYYYLENDRLERIVKTFF